MARLEWQSADVRTDPLEPEYHGDPADIFQAVAELLERPDWHRRAACRGKGPRLWFPHRGEDTIPARTICAGCEVRQECAATALAWSSWEDGGGIWGGLSARQRREARRTAA